MWLVSMTLVLGRVYRPNFESLSLASAFVKHSQVLIQNASKITLPLPFGHPEIRG